MTDLGRARLGTCLVFFICGIGHGTWAPRLAEIKTKIGASDGELGLSLLMLGIGALIAMPVTGALVGRFGSKAVSFAMALAHGIVFPLMAFAWSWITLGLAMMLYGVAVGSLDVAMNVQATEIERKKGQPIMSSFHGVYSVGDMAGGARDRSRGLDAAWPPGSFHDIGICPAASRSWRLLDDDHRRKKPRQNPDTPSFGRAVSLL